MIWKLRVIVLAGILSALQESAAPANEEGRFLSEVRQITFQGKAGEGYFSPDGNALIFQSVRELENPFYQIYLIDFAGGETTRVSPGIGKTTCAFFQPGSDRVLFASTHLDPNARQKQQDELVFVHSGKTRRYSWDYDSEMDIFSAKSDGSDLRRLTDAPGYDAEGSYSPDGKRIVFTSLRTAFPLDSLSLDDKQRFETDPAYFAEIYIMDADGRNQRRLTSSPGYDGGPFFSPDGERVIWRRFDTNGLVADVFSMKLDGSDTRQITHFGAMSWAPYPHPSGKYLVFTSNKLGMENFELFIVDMAGKHEPVRVTFTDGFDGLPVFSPDGNKICWTSKRGGNVEAQLFMAKWNDGAALAALDRGTDSHSLEKESPPITKIPLSPDIRADDARAHVSTLASDAFEGRLTGSEGARKAADYISGQLAQFGIQPLASLGSYFEPFSFASGVRLMPQGNGLSIQTTNQAEEVPFEAAKGFQPLSFSANGTAEGEVVFVGYGLSVPGKGTEGYDSYEGLDLTNKIALALRYVPESVEAARRQELNRYAALRYKAMLARERGAKAILIVAGPNSPNAGELIPLSSDGTIAGSDILAASITLPVAEKLVSATGKSLKELQTALDSENPHVPKGMVLSGARARLSLALQHERKEDRNVIGAIPPTNGKSEYVMLGAHFDHLGFGESSSSRAGGTETNEVHNGADDNASGVAAVLELAAYFSAQKAIGKPLDRGLIFAFWSGEEMGLLGSAKFADQPPLPLTNIIGYLNFDMVGRLRDKLVLQGAGSSPLWRKLIEKRNLAAGFDLTVQDDPYLPSDTTSLYPKGIPVLAFFTGSHDDYHRPTDDAEKLNYEGVQHIADFARAITMDLAGTNNRPDYVRVEQSNPGGQRETLRAYLGTIPDYASDPEVKGVKLSGVRPGSPAEKGGLKAGDVIIEFAGQKIANIYDYTYALDAVKIGESVSIVVKRDDQPEKLSVTPVARK